MNSINECNANERIHRRTEINTANANTCRKTRHTGQGITGKGNAYTMVTCKGSTFSPLITGEESK